VTFVELELAIRLSHNIELLHHPAENVLIGRDGYPVVIDFGFAKYVVSKTYTLCGTPASTFLNVRRGKT
jgi:protein kinase A